MKIVNMRITIFLAGLCSSFLFLTFLQIILNYWSFKNILRANYEENMVFGYGQDAPTSSYPDQRNTMLFMCWTRTAAFEQTAHSEI